MTQPSLVPAQRAWPALLARDGDALFDHYRHMPEALGNEKGTLGLIFGKAQNKFRKAKLRRVIVDLRTSRHFTLKTARLKRDDSDEFVRLYNPANRHDRKAARSAEQSDGRWLVYAYDDLIARDEACLDIFWFKDDSLADSDNLPPPEVIAQEIVEDLEAALEQFRLIAGDMNSSSTESAGS